MCHMAHAAQAAVDGNANIIGTNYIFALKYPVWPYIFLLVLKSTKLTIFRFDHYIQ